MNWLGRLYKFFWARTSARPWTYEIRDWSNHHPFAAGAVVATTIILGLGIELATIVLFAPWWAVALSLPAVLFWNFMAFIAGHLYWQTAGDFVKESGTKRRTLISKIGEWIKDWLSWREV